MPKWSWLGLFLVSALTRLYKLDVPACVCWDEVHFGKMAGWYLNGSFFFDVHPPAGKLMIALAGYLSGYNGSELYANPGDPYNTTHYVWMRGAGAVAGASLPVLTGGLVACATGGSFLATLLGFLLVFLDNGCLTLARFILLDQFLLFAVLGNLLAYAVSRECLSQGNLGRKYTAALVLQGFFLFLAISVKFVGLFTVGFIGLLTVGDLWWLLGRRDLPFFAKEFAKRVCFYIVMPLVLYVGCFYVHLTLLTQSGNGDGFFSPGFQAKLNGSRLFDSLMPEAVYNDSMVVLKNVDPGGSYLLSRRAGYPQELVGGTGRNYSQVSGYSHQNEENEWKVRKVGQEENQQTEDGQLALVMPGDLVYLVHKQTGSFLAVAPIQSPVTHRHFLVYAERFKIENAKRFHWRLVTPSGQHSEHLDPIASPVRPFASRLQLVNAQYNCALHQSSALLPDWADNHAEISCHPRLRFRSNEWYVEETSHPKASSHPIALFRPSFLAQFLESHQLMFQINNRLTAKPGERTSRPWHWPVNYEGQAFSGGNHRVYLLGNPVIWWLNAGVMALYPVLYLVYCAIRKRRNAFCEDEGARASVSVPVIPTPSVLDAAFPLYLAWALHYAPFFLMRRVLYYHHYYPAFLISCVVTVLVIHWLISGLPLLWQHCLVSVLVAGCSYSFLQFLPLTFGMDGPMAGQVNSSYSHLKWLESWDI